MLLFFTQNVTPSVALMGCCFVITVILYVSGTYYARKFSRRYQALYHTPAPKGYFERLEASLMGRRTDTREERLRLWKRQVDPDLERLRLRAVVMIVASYVIWGAAVIFGWLHIW